MTARAAKSIIIYHRRYQTSNLKPMEQAKAIEEVFKAPVMGRPICPIDDKLPQKISNIKPETNGAG